MTNIFAFGLLVQKFLFSLFGGGPICDPRDFVLYKLKFLVPRMFNANLKCILASGS